MHLPKTTFSVTGQCVLPAGIVSLTTVVIGLKTGLIVEIKSPTKDCDLYVPQSLIFPGLLDLHVHGREDATGWENYKEDFETLGEAAINGGVVHVAEMGNNPKPPIDDDSYLEKQELTAKSAVPVTLYAMVGPDTKPLSFEVPYKLCHARTTGANDIIFFPSKASIEAAAERYQGKFVSHHCEDAQILKAHSGEVLHERKRPAEAEVSAVEFAIHLTRKYRLCSKLCHCSVCAGIKKIVAAKKQGVQVTSEVTPHHLFFDESMITDANRPRMQMNPPLRTREDREFCIGALREGEIDMLASDHAPHTDEDRRVRKTSGHSHLDTLGAFVTWLMAVHSFTPHDIARVCCVNPAKFLNRFLPQSYGRGYGKIAVSYVGSLTVISMRDPVRVTKDKLKTKCAWSPFEGITFPGSVLYTIIRGKVYNTTMH